MSQSVKDETKEVVKINSSEVVVREGDLHREERGCTTVTERWMRNVGVK